jgi:hypothetical protein
MEARRQSVYTDPNATYAPQERQPRIPKRGTPARQAYEARVVELRNSGMSIFNIAVEMQGNPGTIRTILKEREERDGPAT